MQAIHPSRRKSLVFSRSAIDPKIFSHSECDTQKDCVKKRSTKTQIFKL